MPLLNDLPSPLSFLNLYRVAIHFQYTLIGETPRTDSFSMETRHSKSFDSVKSFSNKNHGQICVTLKVCCNRSWWPSGLSHRLNSSRVVAEDPGLNPALGIILIFYILLRQPVAISANTTPNQI